MNKRIVNLFPNEQPKYVRVYDNGGVEHGGTVDRFTVIFSGKYRTLGVKRGGPRVLGNFQFVCMSEHPFHPMGVCQHGDNANHIDVDRWGFAPSMGRKNHLGTRIPFTQLPLDCHRLVISDYLEIWRLTKHS